jgi:hypothetical protein
MCRKASPWQYPGDDADLVAVCAGLCVGWIVFGGGWHGLAYAVMNLN